MKDMENESLFLFWERIKKNMEDKQKKKNGLRPPLDKESQDHSDS